jgi:hydroxypyruvate reductase
MATRLRKHAQTIFRAALEAADPYRAVLAHVRRSGDTLTAGKRRYRLSSFRDVYVVGAGKAGAPMALAVERVLGSRIRAGLVNVKYAHTIKGLKHVKLNECGHPVPDTAGVEGAQGIGAIAEAAGEGDLVIAVISGGASALLPAPAAPITLDEKQSTTRLLLKCGANIHEINAVRKHISTLKGGQLARLAAPATVISLILSDVIGDDLDVIGSGPTAPDASMFATAAAILDKYAIRDQVPTSVRRRIEAGCEGQVADTPKAGDPVFQSVQNVIIGSNRLAVDAAARRARELGYKPLILSTLIEGETRDVARMHAAIAREIVATGRPLRPPACVISGGETTVTIRGDGLGGRSQEFALAAALDLAGTQGDVLVLCAGTDGTDGPTDAAGAVADPSTIERAAGLGLNARDFLTRNDSYNFFKPLGDLVMTGPTGTNVMDVRLILVA